MIRQKLRRSFIRKINSYIWVNCPSINVEPGHGLYNEKCHMNAFNIAKKYNHEKVALVFYQPPECSQPLIHFINYDDDKFIDNTIGFNSRKTIYSFIRFIPIEEIDNNSPDDILGGAQDYFMSFATFLQKKIGRVEV